jgi:hypothetical protein
MGLSTSTINENRQHFLGVGNLLWRQTRPAAPVLVFLISLIILGVFTALWGPSQKFHRHDDPEDYMALGQSLASGDGYKNPVSFWPDAPEVSRMPGWPAVISVGIRISPECHRKR